MPATICDKRSFLQDEWWVLKYGKCASGRPNTKKIKCYSDAERHDLAPVLHIGSLCAIRESGKWCDGVVTRIDNGGEKEMLEVGFYEGARIRRRRIQRWDLHHRPKCIKVSRRLLKMQKVVIKGNFETLWRLREIQRVMSPSETVESSLSPKAPYDGVLSPSRSSPSMVRQRGFTFESSPSPRVRHTRMCSYFTEAAPSSANSVSSKSSCGSVSSMSSAHELVLPDDVKENQEPPSVDWRTRALALQKELDGQKTRTDESPKADTIQLRLHPFVDEKDDTLCGACQRPLRETGCCEAHIHARLPHIQKKIKDHDFSANYQQYVISEVTGWI